MISAIDRFRIVPLSATESRLLFDGIETKAILNGLALEAQFACDHGFLLWLTYDCPFEELLRIYLVSSEFELLDQDQLGCIYTAGILMNLTITGPDSLEFSFYGGDRWTLTIAGAKLKLAAKLKVGDAPQS